MFTGIVTGVGTVRDVTPIGGGRDMRLVIAPRRWADTARSPLGASIACSGCCLTVVERGADWFAVDASAETLAQDHARRAGASARGSTSSARCGSATNSAAISSPAMSMASARCCRRRPRMARCAGASACRRRSRASSPPKGSVAVDGVSLTVNEVEGATLRRQHHPAHRRRHHLRPAAARRRGQSSKSTLLARYVARLQETR